MPKPIGTRSAAAPARRWLVNGDAPKGGAVAHISRNEPPTVPPALPGRHRRAASCLAIEVYLGLQAQKCLLAL